MKLNTQTLLLKAKKLLKKGEIKEAQQIYLSILEAFPKNVQAHNSLKELDKKVTKVKHKSLSRAQLDSVIDGMDVYRKAGSVWPGVQNLLLMARSLGLGAAPTTLALRDQGMVREALSLPPTFAALCLIPVGFPQGRFGPVTRHPVADIMRFDRWSD